MQQRISIEITSLGSEVKYVRCILVCYVTNCSDASRKAVGTVHGALEAHKPELPRARRGFQRLLHRWIGPGGACDLGQHPCSSTPPGQPREKYLRDWTLHRFFFPLAHGGEPPVSHHCGIRVTEVPKLKHWNPMHHVLPSQTRALSLETSLPRGANFQTRIKSPVLCYSMFPVHVPTAGSRGHLWLHRQIHQESKAETCHPNS